MLDDLDIIQQLIENNKNKIWLELFPAADYGMEQEFPELNRAIIAYHDTPKSSKEDLQTRIDQLTKIAHSAATELSKNSSLLMTERLQLIKQTASNKALYLVQIKNIDSKASRRFHPLAVAAGDKKLQLRQITRHYSSEPLLHLDPAGRSSHGSYIYAWNQQLAKTESRPADAWILGDLSTSFRKNLPSAYYMWLEQKLWQDGCAFLGENFTINQDYQHPGRRKVHYDHQAKQFKTDRYSSAVMSNRQFLYNIDRDGTLYIAHDKYHSYVMRGASVLCAGMIRFNALGQVVRIDTESGHYQPTNEHLTAAIEKMKKKYGDDILAKNIEVVYRDQPITAASLRQHLDLSFNNIDDFASTIKQKLQEIPVDDYDQVIFKYKSANQALDFETRAHITLKDIVEHLEQNSPNASAQEIIKQHLRNLASLRTSKAKQQTFFDAVWTPASLGVIDAIVLQKERPLLLSAVDKKRKIFAFMLDKLPENCADSTINQRIIRNIAHQIEEVFSPSAIMNANTVDELRNIAEKLSGDVGMLMTVIKNSYAYMSMKTEDVPQSEDFHYFISDPAPLAMSHGSAKPLECEVICDGQIMSYSEFLDMYHKITREVGDNEAKLGDSSFSQLIRKLHQDESKQYLTIDTAPVDAVDKINQFESAAERRSAIEFYQNMNDKDRVQELLTLHPKIFGLLTEEQKADKQNILAYLKGCSANDATDGNASIEDLLVKMIATDNFKPDYIHDGFLSTPIVASAFLKKHQGYIEKIAPTLLEDRYFLQRIIAEGIDIIKEYNSLVKDATLRHLSGDLLDSGERDRVALFLQIHCYPDDNVSVVKAVALYGKQALEYLPNDFKETQQVLYNIAQVDSLPLREMAAKITANPDDTAVVIAGMMLDPALLRFASTELQANATLKAIAAITNVAMRKHAIDVYMTPDEPSKLVQLIREDPDHIKYSEAIIKSPQLTEILAMSSWRERQACLDVYSNPTDEMVILQALKITEKALSFTAKTLLSNPEFILKVIAIDIAAVKDLELGFKPPVDFVVKALKINPACHEIFTIPAPEKIVDEAKEICNMNFIFSDLRWDLSSSSSLSETDDVFVFDDPFHAVAIDVARPAMLDTLFYPDTKSVVLEAVKSYGCALKYASGNLQADDEVIAAAIKNDLQALMYVSPEKIKDTTSLLKVLSNNNKFAEVDHNTALIKIYIFLYENNLVALDSIPKEIAESSDFNLKFPAREQLPANHLLDDGFDDSDSGFDDDFSEVAIEDDRHLLVSTAADDLLSVGTAHDRAAVPESKSSLKQQYVRQNQNTATHTEPTEEISQGADNNRPRVSK